MKVTINIKRVNWDGTISRNQFEKTVYDMNLYDELGVCRCYLQGIVDCAYKSYDKFITDYIVINAQAINDKYGKDYLTAIYDILGYDCLYDSSASYIINANGLHCMQNTGIIQL